ncbi:MAG: hypothetical protein HC859_12225 [Bacteroidia bacterium]|nr:hypothetical protein [Bacteroidia bacterium]
MRVFTQAVLIAILTYIALLPGPWWLIGLVGFVVGYALPGRLSFVGGFAGVALMWLIKAWLQDASTTTGLSAQVAGVLHMSAGVLYLATALIGGLVGGFATMTGSLLRAKKR